MNDINKLISICKDLKLEDILSDLTFIKSRIDEPNKEIFIPLVGEFSSGKTSLINALTDCKKLETASQATTATIFEVHFGCDRCHAETIDANDQKVMVDDIAELKNDSLSDVKLVRVFDTSKQVPNTTVLVDTPGLSSNDPRHKIALTSYLPQSDAILLVADVNQQITRSLIDFVNTTKLTNKPVYLIITKCDTKTKGEVEEVKQYIIDNIKLPLENIVCVSASSCDLNELYNLFGLIQKDKNAIVTKVLESRVKKLAENILSYVDELIKKSSSFSDVDKNFEEQKRSLDKMNNNIDKLIHDASKKISEKGEECSRTFKNIIFTRLDSIVQTQGQDCDEAVYSGVNTLANITLSNFKKDIQSIIVNLARDRQKSIDAVPLQTLDSLDMSDLTFNPFTYNLQLSQIGHENDKMISGIAKVGLAVGAVAAIAMAAPSIMGGGAAAGAKAGVEGGSAATGGVAESSVAAVGGSASAVGEAADLALNIHQSVRLQRMMNNTQRYASAIGKQVKTVESYNQQYSEYTPSQKGVIETGVSWITEQLKGKPQRRRAISNYIEMTLMPEFENGMDNLRSELTKRIENLIHEEAQQNIAQMEAALDELCQKRNSEKDAFEQEMAKLNEYKKDLSI
jgi:GTPase Era involved in 16S rRNA processing